MLSNIATAAVIAFVIFGVAIGILHLWDRGFPWPSRDVQRRKAADAAAADEVRRVLRDGC